MGTDQRRSINLTLQLGELSERAPGFQRRQRASEAERIERRGRRGGGRIGIGGGHGGQASSIEGQVKKALRKGR